MYLASSCVSLLAAVSLLQVPVQAQEQSKDPSTPSSSENERTTERPPATSATTEERTTTTTTTTTTTAITTTTIPLTTTTTTATTVPPITSDPLTTTDRPAPTQQSIIPSSNPSSNPLPPNISTTLSLGPNPTNKGSSSSSSSSSNVPAIVGSIVGILAVVVIVATSVICYRRRRRNNRELTFDALQGMSGPGVSSKNRASHNFLTGASPTMSGGIGLNSMTTGGYEDGYNDYDMQSTAGYPTPHHAHAMAYNNVGYSDYATSSPHLHNMNPTIFQEDPAAAQYATASSMGLGREGFDQNLPELVYNGAGGVDQSVGYYDESDMYDPNWHPDGQHHDDGQHTAGYVGAAGLWVSNPEDQYQQQEAHSDVDYQVYAPASAAAASATAALSAMKAREGPTSTPLTLNTTIVDSDRFAAPKPNSHSNPQALPDSPILQSGTLRGGDLFGPDGDAMVAPVLKDPNTSGSPRILSSRELESIELSRPSPALKSSGEGASSYAADYGSRPSTDSKGATLRTLRPEEWS
ncbi:hypothetical protein BGZ72_009452 [Mortierella alpina]|nr:hypothetical protein BGZ72_009452 [Mortierella alpina]